MIEKRIKNELTLRRWQRFKSHPAAVVSVVVLLIVTALSFTAEFWANSRPILLKYQGQWYFPVAKEYHPSTFGIEDEVVMDFRALDMSGDDGAIWPILKWNPFETNKHVEQYPSPPSAENWLGTDDRGRDILTRLLYGFRYSLSYAVLVWIICFAIGTVTGGVMGYFGGGVDFFGQRVVEVLSTVPQFFLLIIVISIFQPNLAWLVLLSCLFGWINISYYMRAEFLKLRKRDFVDAARSLGASHLRIILVHVLPNALGPILTFSPFVIAGHVTALASLDFLGFGLPAPTPSWGELLSQSQKNFTVAWWIALFPSLALFMTLVLLSLVGEATRDAMDPNRN